MKGAITSTLTTSRQVQFGLKLFGSPSQNALSVDTDIMCHLWKMPKTDTFTYTCSQLALDKLFIIMAVLADAGDTEAGTDIL